MPLNGLIALVLSAAAPLAEEPVNPFPRPELPPRTLREWRFDQSTEGWTAQHACTARAADGCLRIDATGDDPYLHSRVDLSGGEVALEIRARSSGLGNGSVFWTTRQSPARGEDKTTSFRLTHDNQWRTYRVAFSAPGRLTDLRLDPGGGPGVMEIDWMRLVEVRRHPLGIEKIEHGPKGVRATVRNYGSSEVRFTALGRDFRLGPAELTPVDRPYQQSAPLEAIALDLKSPGLPDLRRTVFVYHDDAEADWIARPVGEFFLEVATTGTVARIRRGNETAAVVAPLVHFDGRLPALRLVAREPAIRFEGESIRVELAIGGDELQVSIDSRRPCEGPVVRALGDLEQGLLAGLEYLRKGERSSSKLDVETEAHLRYAPDPLLLTMPLAVLATDRASVAMLWRDTALQPLFATPNFFDATNDHRMTLRGTKIEATVRVARERLVETILWAVKRHGLPPLPSSPRTEEQQRDLCLAALNGPLKSADGWGHCVESRWQRRWFADIASTQWRLTGEIPHLPELVPGGTHIGNDSIYFVTGRAEQWKAICAAEVQKILRRQQPDGSFRHQGEFARGHFEDTAVGICARPATTLLEYAWVTGDEEARRAGLKALDYLRRFDVPRGAQVWEIPLHTPDQLASAYAVWACVRGYQLTGSQEYLTEGRKWALTGVPFVYLWGRYPVMVYGTPPVYGATNWKAPVWFGLPVQWVGLVYAYALNLLAPYDDSLDWRHLARGILIAGEQMQYPDGHYAGLLPDAFALAEQERRPWTINPCGLVSVRMALEGQVDSLCVAADDKHRVAAPFPVVLRGGKAEIQARRGLTYQVLIDGRVVEVDSQGKDVVPLEWSAK